MAPLLPLVLATGSPVCIPRDDLLDYSQVSERILSLHTEAVCGTVRLENPLSDSAFVGGRLIEEALGGMVQPDPADRAATAQAIRSKSSRVEPRRIHRGTFARGR